MSEVIDQWKARLRTRPWDDRTELAHFLLCSLDPEDVHEAQEGDWDEELPPEARRRIAEIRGGRAIGRPVDEFMAESRERYP
jgi:hypothetical protein